MKTVSFEQSYWLTGYYEDFHSVRAVADDKNTASSRTLSHTLSHHGSLYGGENILSPRFSHPYVERLGSGEYAEIDPAQHGGTGSNDSWDYAQTADTKLKMNRGLHEWILLIRQTPMAVFPKTNQDFLSRLLLRQTGNDGMAQATKVICVFLTGMTLMAITICQQELLTRRLEVHALLTTQVHT